MYRKGPPKKRKIVISHGGNSGPRRGMDPRWGRGGKPSPQRGRGRGNIPPAPTRPVAIPIPWCIIGDLNELANPSEKSGGKHYPLSKFDRLNDFLGRINAISVPFRRYPFTWKKPIHTHLIYERLDRATLRNDWVNLYLDSIIRHGTFSYSDHCPIILSATNPIQHRKKLSFQFQNFWCQYRKLDPIVKEQWQVHNSRHEYV